MCKENVRTEILALNLHNWPNKYKPSIWQRFAIQDKVCSSTNQNQCKSYWTHFFL